MDLCSDLYTTFRSIGKNGNGHEPVISLTGRYLAHCRYDPVGRAFLAADLHSGALQLTRPTMVQAAQLARINVTYAWWAAKRQTERGAIKAGLMPLVPARHSVTSGKTVLLPPVEINDTALVDFIRGIGLERVLDAAVVVEAAQ
jgi:hypothetical protein